MKAVAVRLPNSSKTAAMGEALGVGGEEGKSIRRAGAHSAQGGGERKESQVRTKVGAGQHQVLSPWRMNLHLGPEKGRIRQSLYRS